jgi:hypothetical protein
MAPMNQLLLTVHSEDYLDGLSSFVQMNFGALGKSI